MADSGVLLVVLLPGWVSGGYVVYPLVFEFVCFVINELFMQ